ncbi:DUF7946 domain-containing protein [Thioclava electrotropha]|uniref:Uncharacterized protein n=1 Tax=Thioclava electrotropha TaxID=1549850 RepID=A0ABX6YXB3_9RHOB|nr:hypothetical protein [Thioclava electrotropha]QPZ92371.1 hypothetical protein AKL02_016705 [Thioclava electrotropha]
MECYFDLRYEGRWADRNGIEFYDVAQALIGFERVIGLTTHLLLNGKVLVQSPSKHGFSLVALPADEGSWKWTVGLALGFGQVVHAFGTAPPDTAFGWLTKSAVEYVIQETLGFSPNFDETLGKQIERYKQGSHRVPVSRDLSIERFDSLLEKTESGVKALHRPIIQSGSAERANFDFRSAAQEANLDVYVDADTFDYVDRVITSEDFSDFRGVISSYNSNTYKGRLYVEDEKRTIPFELAENMRSLDVISAITRSLSRNAQARAGSRRNNQEICLQGLRNETPTGRLKSIYVIELVTE